MSAKLLRMEILNDDCEPSVINVYDEYQNFLCVHYYKKQGIIHYLEQNNLGCYLKQNENQLLKILHSKREGSFYKGFKLEFVIIPNFYFIQNEDFNRYIVLDRRNGKLDISSKTISTERIHEVYTDGSYFNRNNKSGYACIIRYPEGEEKLVQKKLEQKGNNIAELSAVQDALESLNTFEKIRIYTDSRYVIKGLVQWIHYWKINQWKTVHNENVKHIDTWKNCEELTQDKYIEFKWVKGHSNHLENSICDMMAKEAAKNEPL